MWQMLELALALLDRFRKWVRVHSRADRPKCGQPTRKSGGHGLADAPIVRKTLCPGSDRRPDQDLGLATGALFFGSRRSDTVRRGRGGQPKLNGNGQDRAQRVQQFQALLRSNLAGRGALECSIESRRAIFVRLRSALMTRRGLT